LSLPNGLALTTDSAGCRLDSIPVAGSPLELAFARDSRKLASTHSPQEFLMSGSGSSARGWVPVLFLAGGLVSLNGAQQPSTPPRRWEARPERPAVKQFVTRHCLTCHNSEDKKAGLALDAVSSEDVAAHPDVWEKVARKLAGRQMPPAGRPRPDERTYA